tara:strand:- start:584 stop:769 length:186 start_codon:yes stop_codon:yes gene_type:complete
MERGNWIMRDEYKKIYELESENSELKEKIKEAIKILNSHNYFDSKSKSWAIHRCVSLLEKK